MFPIHMFYSDMLFESSHILKMFQENVTFLCFLEWNLLFPVSGRSTTALALQWILFGLVSHFK